MFSSLLLFCECPHEGYDAILVNILGKNCEIKFILSGPKVKELLDLILRINF